jgi:hypothetical protein
MADRDDLIDDDAAGLPDSEDDLSATLREEMGKLSGGEGDEDDNGGFDAPLDESAIEPRSTVEEEEGVKRVQDARDKATTTAGKAAADPKPEDKADPLKDKTPDPKPQADPKADPKPEDKPEAKDAPKDAPSVSDEDYAAAIGGMPEGVRSRIEAERADYQAVMAPFKGREKELETLGIQPKDAVAYFVNVNDYAQRDPAGYVAWVVGQTSGGDTAKAEEFLKGAAAKLGYKVEKDTGTAEDDDPFMSDRERELIEENRRLKAAGTTQPEYGPDTPQEQSRRAVMDVIAESGADGQPLRPHFEKLQPTILAIVKAEVAASGKPMDADSLRRAYEQAELAHPDTREAATQRLIAAQSAAQPAADVAKPNQNAASVAKAKAASTKIIGGPGQGAGPQPAEDADLGLEAFLRKQMAGSS